MKSGSSNGTVIHSVGYLYLMEGQKKILCKGLRHSFCNHFNGRMPPGQEVVAEWTNSAGLVHCGRDPTGQTNVTLWCTTCAYTTIHWLHRRGQFSQGISETQAFRHTPTLFHDFERLLFFNKNDIADGGKPAAQQAKYQTAGQEIQGKASPYEQENSANCICFSLQGTKENEEVAVLEVRLHVCQMTFCSQQGSVLQDCTDK